MIRVSHKDSLITSDFLPPTGCFVANACWIHRSRPVMREIGRFRLPKSYFLNLLFIFLPQYASIEERIECYFVCAVSLTHSLRLFKPHLAQHKYIISRRLHWMPFKLELFSRETTCLHATVISTVSVRMAVTSLPALLAIKGSARNRQDVRLTGRSPIRAGHAKNLSLPITTI